MSLSREAISALLEEALDLIDEDCDAARDRIRAVQQLVEANVPDVAIGNGVLADWQARYAKDYIQANLSTRLRLETVAGLVKLSASYFSRAFKSTTGISYSRYVAIARIERAKRLLLTTDMPLSQIALACGLADQSHLTRLFKQIEKLPPVAWRRQVMGQVPP